MHGIAIVNLAWMEKVAQEGGFLEDLERPALVPK